MIQKVEIQNFKSVQDLDLELGRLNVFIGENGCGKTNILEAIAMGSAAVENKVSNEFLSTRGIRVTEPEMMASAFDKKDGGLLNAIKITLYTDDNYHSTNTEIAFKRGIWEVLIEGIPVVLYSLLKSREFQEGYKKAEDELPLDKSLNVEKGTLSKMFDSFLKNREDFLNISKIVHFVIYCPENSKLRQFQEEGQILPLGIGGEGLFKHFVRLSQERPEAFDKIKKHLEIIDWFEDLAIPTDLVFTERRLNIRDRFLHPDLQFFDQRSSNEGFLYLMFYFTLFISEYTPGFFAIDNIDNALNPKLCSKLIETLAQLAKDHQKQAILTTHNPAILDGLNLDDDEQRLFVIYRNADGHTTAKRVQKKAQLNGSSESVRLSEAFIRGYLGGIPKNF